MVDTGLHTDEGRLVWSFFKLKQWQDVQTVEGRALWARPFGVPTCVGEPFTLHSVWSEGFYPSDPPCGHYTFPLMTIPMAGGDVTVKSHYH